ncbi:uncharacterized protein LTHEOB_12876 [Lasiodiplodia theobromae]|uniref:uncharacterized protein n=1 Tax=Lasiodiplodia theobromae TaxID=45133 RepID=UPI0015C3E8A0|nr:uncharacterized protein LTHEOB_12876 [Lasiodiplodia theobromae]KAF4534688.1 hypothetical protein LTHEOB_12876 [Lasiodiplodia theobromae]
MYSLNFIMAVLALGTFISAVPVEPRQATNSIVAAPLFPTGPGLVPPPAMLGPYGLKSSSASASTEQPSTFTQQTATFTKKPSISAKKPSTSS